MHRFSFISRTMLPRAEIIFPRYRAMSVIIYARYIASQFLRTIAPRRYILPENIGFARIRTEMTKLNSDKIVATEHFAETSIFHLRVRKNVSFDKSTCVRSDRRSSDRAAFRIQLSSFHCCTFKLLKL